MNAPPPPQQQRKYPNGQNPRPADRRPPPLVPPSLTIPAGTVIQIRTTDFLSSDGNHKGDTFIATLAQPIVIDGWVVMRRGQTITGQVTDAVRAGRVKGVSRLQLDLSQLTLVDGQLVPVQTQLLNASAGTSNGRDAAAIGVTTGTGAAIGAAAAGGPGAAIGAGAGFVASVAGVLLTRGKPTIITPETMLTFKTEQPVTISTVRGQLAFRPVTQADYHQRRNRATRIIAGRIVRTRIITGRDTIRPTSVAYYGPVYLTQSEKSVLTGPNQIWKYGENRRDSGEGAFANLTPLSCLPFVAAEVIQSSGKPTVRPVFHRTFLTQLLLNCE